jgi:hypothetical protein
LNFESHGEAIVRLRRIVVKTCDAQVKRGNPVFCAVRPAALVGGPLPLTFGGSPCFDRSGRIRGESHGGLDSRRGDSSLEGGQVPQSVTANR